VDQLRKIAAKLYDELERRKEFEPSAAEFYADEQIIQHLGLPYSPRDFVPGRQHRLFAPVADYIAKFMSACDAAKDEMERMTDYWREGLSWDEWIVSITTIVREHELPHSAAVDQMKSPVRYSPFVLLVHALQKHAGIPQELCRHTHSLGALTEAIKRARQEARRMEHIRRRNLSD